MPTPFWSSPTIRDRLKHLERPGFSVEFLRRNPNYRSEFARTLRRITQGTADAKAASEKLACRWGLLFCP